MLVKFILFSCGFGDPILNKYFVDVFNLEDDILKEKHLFSVLLLGWCVLCIYADGNIPIIV